ncbi:MAG: cytochrome P450 [Bacteroidia bacterium]|jgi:cytochrome P450
MENEIAPPKPLNLPPVAKGGWPIGSARKFTQDRLGFFEDYVPKYGGLFELTSVFFRFITHFDKLVIVTDPDMVKRIIQDNNKNYVKSYGYQVLKVLLGEGLLTSEGGFWRKQRRLMQPAFHRDRLASFVSTYAEFGQDLVDKWSKVPDATAVDVSKDLMEV